MPGVRLSNVRKALLAFGLALTWTAQATAQVGSAGLPDTLGLGTGKPAKGNGAQWTATLEPGAKSDEAVLRLSVKLAPHFYVYPTDEANGALMKFELRQTSGLTPIDKAFQADHEPKLVRDPDLEKDVRKYYDAVSWTQRFRITPGAAAPAIAGEVVYQICDDQNCRPGQKFPFDVKLAAAGAAATRTAATGDLTFAQTIPPRGSKKVGGTWTVTINPGQAAPGSEVTLTVAAKLVAGWHTYALNQEQLPDGSGPYETVIQLAQLGGLQPVEPTFTSSAVDEVDSDAFEGIKERMHHGTVTWTRTLRVPADAAPGVLPLSGQIAWQFCKDDGMCLPVTGFEFAGELVVAATAGDQPAPLLVARKLEQEEATELIMNSRNGGTSAPGTVADAGPPANPREAGPQVKPADPAPAGPGQKGNLATMPLHVFLGLAVVAGFAALLTPCVFPMIPITVSFFQKQAEKEHHKPISMAAVYCLGIIGAFTGLGMLMSILFGATALPEFANTVPFNLALAALLIFFGLNLLGMFEIRMPSWLLTYTAGKESKGGFIGVLFMALTFTLTSFTCTFAFAGGLLVMAESGDRLRPMLGLLAFSTAFSLPFFFLALFPSVLKKLPRSGGWMNVAKVIMGLVELGAAVKFLGAADQRWNGQPLIIDFHLMIAIWAVISVAAALYLFGLFRLPHDVPTEHIGVFRFVCAMSFLGYAFYLGVGLFGAQKPQGAIWKNVEALANSTFDVGTDPSGPFSKHGELKYALDFERALDFAIAENKPLFLDFTGVNCANCRKMEKGPMSLPEIETRLGKFVRIQLFTDAVPIPNREEAERLRAYNIKLQKEWFGDITLPSYVVIPPDRAALKDRSLILSSLEGFNDDSAFARFLDQGWTGWQKVLARQNGQVVKR